MGSICTSDGKRQTSCCRFITSGKNIKLGPKDMFVQLVAGSSKPPLVTTLALNKIFAPSKIRGNEYALRPI